MTSGYHPIPTNHSEGGSPADRYEPSLLRSVLKDLELGDPGPKPGGAFVSGVLAFLSLGILPLLLWHDRFRDFVDQERQRLRRFAEWVRLHSTRPETMDLRVAGEDLGTRPLLSALSILSIIGVVVLIVSSVGSKVPILAQLLSYTYEFRAGSRDWQFPLSDRQRVFAAWNVGLIAAYLFHWVQVQAHAADVRRFVRYANRVFRAADVPRVPIPRLGLGIGFIWAIAGVILASKGAWWGLALALSGAAQHRYMVAESGRVRRALAARVREMAKLPLVEGEDAPRFAGVIRRCPHVRCLAPVPSAWARFCPRCGHNLQSSSGSADRVTDTG